MLIQRLPDGDAIHYYKKSIVVIFAGKRHVISTGPNNGGYREDLQAVFNHDDNPGPGMACVMRDDTYEGHMNIVALDDLGLDPKRCSGLCTAADMANASIRTLTFQDLAVTAVVTAGIEHNGGRAGDPATFYEENETFYSLKKEKTGPKPGTINIILHTNACLDAGTLARMIMTATEAKTVALQELMARSHNSSGLATGSGTDGIICICNPEADLRLTNAGKNSKLGELIGKTVKAAVKEALRKQSGLCPERQRDIIRIMERYGVDEDRLWDICRNDLTVSKADFMDRLDGIKKDEKLVEITFLYAHILDLLSWGLISPEGADRQTAELVSRQGIACAGQEELLKRYIRFILLQLIPEEPPR